MNLKKTGLTFLISATVAFFVYLLFQWNVPPLFLFRVLPGIAVVAIITYIICRLIQERDIGIREPGIKETDET